MVTATQLRTANDLLDLGELAGDFELIEGELATVTPPDFKHGTLQIKLGAMLLSHVDAHSFGKVSGDAGYLLQRSPDTVLAPDLSFVAYPRIPDQHSAYLELAPDLAVEIVSPGNSPGEIERKVAIYLHAGCQAVWVIYPRERRVAVHVPGQAPAVYGEGESIDGAPALPGLSLPVLSIFE